MMKALIIAEHDQQSLKSATAHAITAAKQLATTIDILFIGYQCERLAKQSCHFEEINQVFVADDEVYAYQLAENSAKLIMQYGQNYDYIIAGASTFSKNLLPRVAALLDVAMVSDVMQIVAADTFVRPMYAGNILATVKSLDNIRVMTIRTTAFAAAKIVEKSNVTIVSILEQIPNSSSRFENQQLTPLIRPELISARIIISGGRGLKSAENFKLLEEIADLLNAAVGASRAAVDAGFAPNDYQIGQTGKIVAPDLYLAVGISGAIQHLAGMKDSKVIVAINNDPEAPIFQVADYILVGDLFKILPELRAELEKVK